jgi:hypothetical protein
MTGFEVIHVNNWESSNSRLIHPTVYRIPCNFTDQS